MVQSGEGESKKKKGEESPLSMVGDIDLGRERCRGGGFFPILLNNGEGGRVCGYRGCPTLFP